VHPISLEPAFSPLGGDAGLGEVETVMQRLCRGSDAAGEIALEHLATGGKRLRARLALAAIEALGRPRADGVAWAAACELVHNGTLVHDDLQDGDEQRRGAPTVWVRHGAAQAINAGDLLLIVPYMAVAELPVADAVRWELCRALASRTAAVIRGQADEQRLPARDAISFTEYEAAVVGKTSALFELPIFGAALIAGRDLTVAGALSAPFRDLGVLFQMQDDVLDLYGDKGRGRAGSDLYEGKVSCLVVEHAALNPSERTELLAFLRAPRGAKAEAAVAKLIARFRDGGALAAVLERLRDLRRRLERSELYASAPALGPLMHDLVSRTLAPIEPLLRS
jgi:geranylgeranyl diphosphate synthase type I